jgi:hypothetical protein
MMVAIGAIGVAAAAVGTLAASVAAGMLLMRAMLRALEAAVPKPEPAARVADFGEYVRRTTGPLVSRSGELERAA